VLPYLDEQLMGEPERRKEFRLSTLKEATKAPVADEATTASDAEVGDSAPEVEEGPELADASAQTP
jgi:hypothetical protein